MKIAVFGAGAVGGYFGGRLSQSGQDVTFIARGEHLRAMLKDGLQVDSPKGNFCLQPVHATDNPAEIGIVDAVLVAVKAWQAVEAAQAARPLVGPDTLVVPLGNGVEWPQQLSDGIGKGHILGGLSRISSLIAGPGHIRHVGLEPSVDFGKLDPAEPIDAQIEQLRQAFENAGVVVTVPPDIRVAMWNKFVFIAAISGVGAVARAPVGVLRSQNGTRRMLESALQEVVLVGRALGVNLADGTAASTLRTIDGLPESTLASMQRDIMEGRPSELEAQNGAVVRFGAQSGVPTPTHEFIYSSLLPQELRARGRLQF